jgi:hypothetical protein
MLRWSTARALVLGMVGMGLHGASSASALTVLDTNFDGVLAQEIAPGSALLTAVQGYAGLGAAGNQFGGSFLRSVPANTVTVSLSNLPQHQTLDIAFLFAAIDSLDGTGTFPAGDFFTVTLDGVTLFDESFANALPSQIQSYVPPQDVLLARRVDLGFSGPGSFFTDSAYDLGADPAFRNLPHSASSATITFFMQGPGNQTLSDESWAIDNLRVQIDAVPEPGTASLVGLGTLLLAAVRRGARR